MSIGWEKIRNALYELHNNALSPYEIFLSYLESSRRRVVEQAIAEYNKYTCIRWVPRTNQRNYVKFIVGGGYLYDIIEITFMTYHQLSYKRKGICFLSLITFILSRWEA